MDVRLKRADIERIAGRLGMTPEDFTARHLHAVEGEEFEITSKPCPFLGSDNRCTIYEFRPDCCREYPYTDKPDFATRTYGHSQNTLVCPAVFWIVEQLRRSTAQ
jgi:Fe-S-cluster containining protein